MEIRVGRAFKLFRESGIEPILIKGWAAARFYPPEHIRLATDTDFAVSSADFEIANDLVHASSADGLAVDLHRELRHLDTVEWLDLVKHSRLIKTEQGNFRVLRPEDHLRVLCVHWLTDGGSNKERLWDIYYSVANRPPDFDWDRFLQPVSEKRQRWLICTIGLAKHFLGLDLSRTPIDNRADDLPQWLVKTVEHEWAAEIKPLPLEVSLFDRKMLFAQIKRRMRPNPIWATVQMEGSFDARTRFFYKIGNTFARIMPSYRRIAETLMMDHPK